MDGARGGAANGSAVAAGRRYEGTMRRVRQAAPHALAVALHRPDKDPGDEQLRRRKQQRGRAEANHQPVPTCPHFNCLRPCCRRLCPPRPTP
eukprot:2942304-Pleurochrysis_carterae.AAC.2